MGIKQRISSKDYISKSHGRYELGSCLVVEKAKMNNLKEVQEEFVDPGEFGKLM